MFGKNIRRLLGALGAGTVVAGFAVTVGAGVADAAPATVTWTDGDHTFTRTISDATPYPGDTVTVSTKFETNAFGLIEFISLVNDVRPECFTFESVEVDGTPYHLDSQDAVGAQITGGWEWSRSRNPSHTFEFTYQVGDNCDLNVPLTTGMRYYSSGSHAYNTMGPDVTVRKDPTTTALADVLTDVRVGQLVPLTATVTGAAAGDIVEFYDGATKIGTAQLGSLRMATLDWIPATGGEHSLSAKYVGAQRTQSSQSSVQTVQVSNAPNTDDGGTGSAGNIFGS
ncbi:Ig-like domain-containing protein [Rhodococcus marinonascens]|uniref:Ig-like domain-containing protein n=1 Tax=Rhodococcus marinonascens TaxID=38311 RepID=UPI0009339AF3|nr:Ig-like domain-containing protein [Rhodococcus marinonascens]